MLIFKYLLAFLSILVCYSLKSQTQTYEFGDGTKLDVTLKNVDPDKGRNWNIYAGGFLLEGLSTYNVGASYYRPTKYYINVMYGVSGFNVDGNIFLTSWKRVKFLVNSLKSTGNTYYKAKIPIEKRRSFGLHLGMGASSFIEPISINGPTAYPLALGVSVLKTMHLDIFTEGGHARTVGTALSRINLDAVYFANDINEGDGFRSLISRLYIDGRTNFWGRKGRMSINYLIGVSLGYFRDLPVQAMIGFGLGYHFSLKKY